MHKCYTVSKSIVNYSTHRDLFFFVRFSPWMINKYLIERTLEKKNQDVDSCMLLQLAAIDTSKQIITCVCGVAAAAATTRNEIQLHANGKQHKRSNRKKKSHTTISCGS